MKRALIAIGFALCAVFLWLWGPFIWWMIVNPHGPGALPFG